jgi:hypothetical protein
VRSWGGLRKTAQWAAFIERASLRHMMRHIHECALFRKEYFGNSLDNRLVCRIYSVVGNISADDLRGECNEKIKELCGVGPVPFAGAGASMRRRGANGNG